MVRDIVKIGDKIDIRRLDNTGKPMHGLKTYVSQLLDFNGNDKANISLPIDKNKVYVLSEGEKYNLCFYTSKGLYQCNCEIMSRYRENNIAIAVVQFTSDIEKFQRRQYYRLECVLESMYHVVTKDEILLENMLAQDTFASPKEKTECFNQYKLIEKEWMKASITDISGGGARFNSEQIHESGEKLKIQLDFDTSNLKKKLIIYAVFIDSIKLVNRYGMYEHRIEFMNIDKIAREEIIKYIFEQERRRRRNEKG